MSCRMNPAIFFVFALIAMASSLHLPTTMPQTQDTTTVPQAANHTEVLAAGSKLLDDIAMGKVIATMGLPDNTSILMRKGTELQVALTTMCNLWDSNEALWDLSSGKMSETDALLKKIVQILIQPTCNWVTILLSEQNMTHSLTCVSESIDRVCRDYHTLSYSKELHTTVSDHTTDANLISSSEWVRSNIQQDRVLPEVYHEILSYSASMN